MKLSIGKIALMVVAGIVSFAVNYSVGYSAAFSFVHWIRAVIGR